MTSLTSERQRVTAGVSQLDRLLGGIHIGDNVIWHDDTGSFAHVFCLNSIRASQAQNGPLIYVGFDRSPEKPLGEIGTSRRKRFTYHFGLLHARQGCQVAELIVKVECLSC